LRGVNVDGPRKRRDYCANLSGLRSQEREGGKKK